MDGGKPIRESRDIDIPLVAAHFFYNAGWADKLNYAFPGKDPKPLGVAGQVIPWNFPLLMAAWKIAPSLSVGCSTIIKPAEQTPLSTIRLAELMQEAGVPDGVINIVPGYGETAGQAIGMHNDIDTVSFTGSSEVGRMFMRYSGDSNLKGVGLEMGGKSPFIVLEDAILDEELIEPQRPVRSSSSTHKQQMGIQNSW